MGQGSAGNPGEYQSHREWISVWVAAGPGSGISVSWGMYEHCMKTNGRFDIDSEWIWPDGQLVLVTPNLKKEESLKCRIAVKEIWVC